MNCNIVAFGFLLAIPLACGAAASDRIKQANIPGARGNVVVSEGALEPRSIGSYSLLVYGARNPQFPYDDFVAGAVRPRDGWVQEIRFSDLDGDESPEIIVIVRSAGTGSRLSADAFQFKENVLKLLASVSELPRDADVLRALRASAATHARTYSSPTHGHE